MRLHVPGCAPEPEKTLSAKSVLLTYAGLYRAELTNDAIQIK